MVMTFIPWFALPPFALVVVDFFHEFAVHVDGLGFRPFTAFRVVAILSLALAL